MSPGYREWNEIVRLPGTFVHKRWREPRRGSINDIFHALFPNGEGRLEQDRDGRHGSLLLAINLTESAMEAASGCGLLGITRKHITGDQQRGSHRAPTSSNSRGQKKKRRDRSRKSQRSEPFRVVLSRQT